MLCPNCSKEIRDSAKVCGYCGHKLPTTPPICPGCGKDVREGAKVCGYCGHKFSAIAQAAAPEPAQTKQEELAEPPPAQEPKISKQPEEPTPVTRVPKPKQETRPRPARKILPTWALGLIGILILAGIGCVILLNSSPKQTIPASPTTISEKPATPTRTHKPTPTKLKKTAAPASNAQVVILSRACGETVTAKADQPIKIHYGYWGALKEFYKENYDYMDFHIYIDGERYYGQRIEQPLALSAIPCVDQANWDVDWQQNGLFMYDILELDFLSAGEYQIVVTYYLAGRVNDGLRDEDGELLVWGPGEYQTLTFQLIIEP